MPTILINTNLLHSAGQDTKQDDLKQDINSIITKLLSKSESMDSFMIKYDLNDLLPEKKAPDDETETSTDASSCICGRLANMFGSLLNKSEQHTEQSNNDERMNSINSELKLLRKYQSDLASKFNLILTKLDNNKTSLPVVSPLATNTITTTTKLALTGAKKRKFNTIQAAVSSTKIKNEHQSDNEEVKVDTKSSSSSSSSSSSGSSITSSSSASTTSSKQEHLPNEVLEEEYVEQPELDDLNNDEEVEDEEVNDEIEEDDLLNGDEIIDQEGDLNEMDDVDQLEATIESTNQSDELNFYKNINKTNKQNSMMRATGFNKSNIQPSQQIQRNVIGNNRMPISSNRNISSTATQQARIPANNNFNSSLIQQTQFMHNHSQAHQQANRSFNNSNQQRTIPAQTNRFNHFNNNNNNNNQINRSQYNDHQYKSIALAPLPSSSSSSASHSAKSDNYDMKTSQSSSPSADIDLNELFKGEGPKFLQLELYKNFKPPIFIDPMNQRSFIDDNLASSAYSKSKSRRNFAAHLAKLVFTPRERLECNCNGRFGKKALDTSRLMAIRNTLFKYYPCKQSTLYLNGDTITSGDHDENNVWIRQCLPAIDESNRVLKKQLIAWYKKNKQMDGKNNGGTSSSFNNSGMYGGFDSGGNNLMASCLVDDDEQLEDDFELNI